MANNIDRGSTARVLLQTITSNIDAYSDAELRDIKNSADVFSMHIRRSLAVRDARMVDEVLKLQPAWVRNCPYENCRRCETETECPAYRGTLQEKAK